MKLELNDNNSNHSDDFSSDSQSSQESNSTDYFSSTAPSNNLTSTYTSFDGLNSGVPTRTTATITPTTLRNIEQTFVELQNNHRDQHQSQAGFVPPSIAQNQFGVIQAGPSNLPYLPSSVQVASSASSGSATYGTDSSGAGSPAAARGIATPPPPVQTKRRNMGGRRPAKAAQNLSPEEEERRKVRRERNKMAAARCRKRRLDHTNELVDETAGLERKKQSLQAEIRQLQLDREELELILRSHRACCRLQPNARPNSPPDVKPSFQNLVGGDKGSTIFQDDAADGVRVKVEVLDDNIMNLDSDIIFTSPQTNKRIMLSAANLQLATTSGVGDLNTPTPTAKPNRPSFLDVPLGITPAQAHGLKANGGAEAVGVAVTTPSNGIPFNFDSLMEGGTGLTPVRPCASQQHRAQPEALTPDPVGPPELVLL